MVDGNTLAVIEENEVLAADFYEKAKHAKSVCVCRCAPSQKAVVAKQMKKVSGKRIACVGDGGNDVAMI